MKWFSAALMCSGFFSLIIFTVYHTGSVMPLWVLLLTLSFKTEDDKNENQTNHIE